MSREQKGKEMLKRVSHQAAAVLLAFLPYGLILSHVSAAAAQAVPVPNPSFEDGDYRPEAAPKGWTWRMQGKAQGRWEAKGHTGRCISIENIGHQDQAVAMSDRFPVEPGHNYRLSFWHRARDPIQRSAEVWIYFGEKNVNAGCRNYTVTTTREWQKRVVEFTSPNIRETFLWFIICERSEDSRFYVDDVVLENLGPAKVTPETISWKTEATSVLKQMGGLFTRVEGPKTSRPLTTVMPLTALRVVNTAPPRTPVIDGILGDWEYSPWASTIGPLRRLDDGRATADGTYAYVIYDERKLYIAWKAAYRGASPAAAVRPEQRDGPVWVDDCLEVLFEPPGGPWIHFIGNAAGGIYDDRTLPGERTVVEWQGKWEYKTSIHPGFWVGELAIAFEDLGLPGPPADGSEWKFDICRTSKTHGEECKWCWLNGVKGFVGREFMGTVRFDSKGLAFHVEPLGNRLGKNVGRLFTPMSRHAAGSLIRGIKILDEGGREILRKSDILTPREGDLSVWGFEYDLPEIATYTFSMSVQDPKSGREVFQLTVPLDARPDLMVNARVFPFQKRVIVHADSSRAGKPDDARSRLRVALSRDGRRAYETSVARVKAHRYEGEFPIAQMPAGTYELHAAVIGGDGKEQVETKQDMFIPPKPVWFGKKIAKTDKVLPPWTPVKAVPSTSAHGHKISVWNRSYEIASHGLPRQISTAGRPMLANPVTIHLFSKGKPISVRLNTKARLLSSEDTRAVVASEAPGERLRFSARTTVEYDGMMKIDFTLDPGPKAIEVDHFTIRFPFRQERAIYLDAPGVAPPFHHVIDKDGWRMERGIGKGRQADRCGRFWIGDDDRGIDFSFVSDEGWRPYDRGDLIRIERRGDRVTVDLNILGKTRLDKPVHGTLLVTATPLRPFPKNLRHINIVHWDGRPMKVVEGADTYASDPLKGWAELGANWVFLSDHWSNGYGRPEPFDPPNFRKLANLAKGLKMKIGIYIGVSCWAERGAEAPYLNEWLAIPTSRSANGGRPDQALISVSLTRKNGGQDCLVYMVDKMIREYDIDGIYIDGAGWGPSVNRDVGFGYVTEDGTVRPTSTILEIRELYKRLYALFVSHGKKPFIDHHATWMLSGAVDAFVTSHLTGEYLAYHAHENTEFPEEFFRIENTGVQWGIPVEILCYNNNIFQRYIANSYVYGCAVRSTLSSFRPSLTGRMMSPIWKAFAGFDVANAEWIPYWKTGTSVQSENPSHKLSLYRHPTDGLLLLLANTSTKPGIASVKFDMQGLGLAGGRATLTVLNKKAHPFEFKDGLLTTNLSADDFVMCRMMKE